MKIRDKKTGAIYSIGDIDLSNNEDGIWLGLTKYTSLAELNEDWEDYEEPKEYFMADWGDIVERSQGMVAIDQKQAIEKRKEIGNYFDTEEEAEKAVEKLKALKRLKDKGFRFEGIKQDYTRFFSQQRPMRSGRKYLQFNKAEDEEWMKENWKDLDLLFSGEDE